MQPSLPTTILGCFLLSLCFFGVQAQSTERDNKVLYLNTVVGVQIPTTYALNKVLSQEGFLPVSNVYFSRGGGFYTIFPKIPIATLFTLSSYTATTSEGERSSWVRATQAGTAIGLTILNNRTFQLIPYGGIVYSWFGVRVAKQEPASTSFNGYFAGQANQLHTSANGFMANAGLQIARKAIGKSKLGENLVLGLRAGYYLPLAAQVWKTQKTRLSDGPQVNTGGLYCSLLIAFAQ